MMVSASSSGSASATDTGHRPATVSASQAPGLSIQSEMELFATIVSVQQPVATAFVTEVISEFDDIAQISNFGWWAWDDGSVMCFDNGQRILFTAHA